MAVAVTQDSTFDWREVGDQVNGLPPGPATKHFDELAAKCAERGLWIVPVGELEGFCRSIEASHGPGFVEKVLEERDITADTELAEARAFVAAIWNRARRTPE